MRGRDGDYLVTVGVHVTRVFSRDEHSTLSSWVDFCIISGINPDTRSKEDADVRAASGTSSAIEVLDLPPDDLNIVHVWPVAVAVCSCRWSRPASSRVMARSTAFVHKQLARMSGCET